MSGTARVAEFVVKTTLEDCPAEARTLVRRAALDTLGVMLAGAAEPIAAAVREVARLEGGAPLATVVGTRLRTSPSWAALANGAAGHAHDFDDTNFALMGHPSVPLLATALAAAEAEAVDGRTLVLGYVVGFEVGAALGTAVNPAHYRRGWHATSSVGTLGCCATACRILGLDATQTSHALGLAASLASGLKENFGSMVKPYHAGHAAQNGLLAALFAREGVSASDTALEGKQGWVRAFADGDPERLASVLAGLGRTWHVVTSGVAVKPYPSCALTHAAIDALFALRREYALEPAEVAEIEVRVNRLVPDVLIHARPTTALERKFSMEFCAATALADGRVDLASFASAPGAAVTELMRRVRIVVDPDLPDRLEQHAWSHVILRLRDGRALDAGPRGAKGHPEHPLSDDELREKFFACATRVLDRDTAGAVADRVQALDELPDVRALTSRLVGELV